MSAVIISAVLLCVAITGSLTGFFERSNTLNAELKTRSSAAANACVDMAKLQIANNDAYVGTSMYSLNRLDSCRVEVSGLSPKILRIQATSSETVTNLLVSYSTTTASVISWVETPFF